MSYYRHDDPRNTLIWEMMKDINEMLSSISTLMDEYACEIDDGYHWVKEEIVLEEEE